MGGGKSVQGNDTIFFQTIFLPLPAPRERRIRTKCLVPSTRQFLNAFKNENSSLGFQSVPRARTEFFLRQCPRNSREHTSANYYTPDVVTTRGKKILTFFGRRPKKNRANHTPPSPIGLATTRERLPERILLHVGGHGSRDSFSFNVSFLCPTAAAIVSTRKRCLRRILYAKTARERV